MKNKRQQESGEVSGLLISTIVLGVLMLGAFMFGGWAFLQYSEQKTNVDEKIARAEAAAKKSQADEDEKKFAEREKEPRREFVGPNDYGRVSFDYPKTWSVFVASDTSKGGTYKAFLNPVVVSPISEKQQFAIRVIVEEKDYDRVVATYEPKIKKGELRTTSVTANGQNGTRLDGEFSKDIRGAAVIFKIRDKTLTIRTDADVHKPEFENIIKTIKYNE